MKGVAKNARRIWWSFVASCLVQAAPAQSNNDYLLWSATTKLTAGDFAIKTKSMESTASFAQFSVDFEVGGFSFLTKNFNKKVHNYFIRSASWIDTTQNLLQSLIYQQTLFDLCEVYTRQLRKALRDHRKQLLKGTGIAKDLNSKFMAEFAKRRLAYDRETAFGTKADYQAAWEKQIASELQSLSEFAYEK